MSTTTVRRATLTNETSELWMRYLRNLNQRDSRLNWGGAARTVVEVAADIYEKQNKSLGNYPMFSWACQMFHEMATTKTVLMGDKLWSGLHDHDYWEPQEVNHRYNTALLLASGALPFNVENKSNTGLDTRFLTEDWIEGIWNAVHKDPGVGKKFYGELADCATEAAREIIFSKDLSVRQIINEISFKDYSHMTMGRSTTFNDLCERTRQLTVEKRVWGNDTATFEKPFSELPVGECGQHKRENIALIALAVLNAAAEIESQQRPKVPLL